jgi:hypothetical protein
MRGLLFASVLFCLALSCFAMFLLLSIVTVGLITKSTYDVIIYLFIDYNILVL